MYEEIHELIDINIVILVIAIQREVDKYSPFCPTDKDCREN